MISHILKISMFSTAILAGGATMAYADCEADLIQLEAAMKAPGLKSDQLLILQDVGTKASSALRKDDDVTCHKLISDALASNGSKMQAAASTGAGLGDLSSLHTITDDTLKLVQKGDMPAAQKRIADLETAWDKGRQSLQAKDPAAWEKIDRAIDAALTQIRASKADAQASADALTTLNTVLSK